MYRNDLNYSKLSEEEQKNVNDYMTRLFQIGIDFLTTSVNK